VTARGSGGTELARAFTGWFALEGECVEVVPLGRGHIHETYLGTWQLAERRCRVVHQRLNTRVFRDPALLMRNWLRVTAHVHAALARAGVPDLERRCLRPIRTRAGGSHTTAGDGAVWRACHFIEGTRAVDFPESPAQAEAGARAFGGFLAQLGDLAPAEIGETIPRFHDLAGRLARLDAAVAADAEARVAETREEVARARGLAAEIRRALAEAHGGPLPLRVVHNDCKLNNVLFDVASGEALCVIDLDTVMPGTVLADFGDLVRGAVCSAPEDETDLDRVRVDPAFLAALVRGYLAGAGPLLAPSELAQLPLAAPLMAVELGIRFLTDHLEGDHYFPAHRPGHNLDRARAQLHLAQQLLEGVGEARRLVEDGARELGGSMEVRR
jgi:Ser/Thr protein kinase RdoA (MazF antagonist)